MFETIERPSARMPMRAAWGARLADRVNELCAAASPGMLVREGLGGTGAEPIPANHRLAKPLQTAAAAKGVFEPIFSERDKEGGEDGEKEIFLSGVGPGLYPYGRNFYSRVTFSDEAKIASGFIGIKITHKKGGAFAMPSIVKISDETDLSDVTQPANPEGRASTVLPLYVIDSGKIIIDCRCLMSLAVRE